MNSTRQFMRELNRLGLTSVVDAGGSSQSYPGDYEVIRELSRQGLLTVRIAYNLYPQRRDVGSTSFGRPPLLIPC
jgi:predicted amidohydrolase YtcJ